ncbi:unnamed protein product, partial [Mesorhabditis spiculigera]
MWPSYQHRRRKAQTDGVSPFWWIILPQLCLLLLLMLYLVVGALIFRMLDKDLAEQKIWDVILFEYGTIATIGWGNVYPSTEKARLFACLYALIGIPLFLLYNDIYFSFISFTTVGFGDTSPVVNNVPELVFTIVYLTWGIVLTTALFRGLHDFMKKVHYLGRRFRGARDVPVYIGGQQVTVSSLMAAVAKEFDVALMPLPYSPDRSKFDSEHYYLFQINFTLRAIAVPVLAIAVMASLCAMFLMCRTWEFHRNFAQLYLNSMMLTVIAEAAAVVQMIFEMFDDPDYQTAITICLWVRNYHICSVVITLNVVMTERLFATYFIANYEAHRYWWVAAGCVGYVHLMSAAWNFLWSLDLIQVDVTVAIALISHVFPLLVIYKVHRLNRRLEEKRLSQIAWAKYSLSQRFQLHENLRTIIFVRNVYIFTVCFDFPILGFIWLYSAADSETARCFWATFADALCLGYAIHYPLLYAISSPRCTEVLKSYIQRLVPHRGRIGVSYKPPPDKRDLGQIEQDNHFAYLHELWDVRISA